MRLKLFFGIFLWVNLAAFGQHYADEVRSVLKNRYYTPEQKADSVFIWSYRTTSEEELKYLKEVKPVVDQYNNDDCRYSWYHAYVNYTIKNGAREQATQNCRLLLEKAEESENPIDSPSLYQYVNSLRCQRLYLCCTNKQKRYDNIGIRR